MIHVARRAQAEDSPKLFSRVDRPARATDAARRPSAAESARWSLALSLRVAQTGLTRGMAPAREHPTMPGAGRRLVSN